MTLVFDLVSQHPSLSSPTNVQSISCIFASLLSQFVPYLVYSFYTLARLPTSQPIHATLSVMRFFEMVVSCES